MCSFVSVENNDTVLLNFETSVLLMTPRLTLEPRIYILVCSPSLYVKQMVYSSWYYVALYIKQAEYNNSDSTLQLLTHFNYW